MSYEFYKVLHLTGVFLILTGLVAVLALRMITEQIPPRPRRLFFISHGLGMLLALVGGFGLAARLGYVAQLPQWVWVKLAIWLILGAGISIAKRKGHTGGPLYVLFIGIAAMGALLAITKPF